jgi:hypothetical protein
MVDGHIALAAAGFVIPRQHGNALQQAGLAGPVLSNDDGDGSIEADFECVAQKRQTKWIRGAVWHAIRFEPYPFQIRRRQPNVSASSG